MSKLLIQRVEKYRIDTEQEAKDFIEEEKVSGEYEIKKSVVTHKEKKKKGEIVDDYYLVELTKVFNLESGEAI